MSGDSDGLIVVFDVGKTNAKLRAFRAGPDGRLDAVETLSTPSPALPGPPYGRIGTDELWSFLIDGMRTLARLGPVRDIVVTTHGCAWALVNGDPSMAGDGLVLPVMDYEWEGVRAFDREYEAIRPPFVETGSPKLPVGLNAARQLHYQARAHADAFETAAHVLPFPQYWVWRLTGRACADISSLGCHSDLWRPLSGAPSTLVAALGIADRLGPVLPAWEVAGTVLPAIARKTGLPAGARVRVGIHDSNASLLPYLGGEEPFALVSTGTWAITFAVGGDASALDERRDCLVNVDARGRPVPSARVMTGREREIVLGKHASARPSETDVEAIIDRDVMLLPSYVPGSGPFPDHGPSGMAELATLTPAERAATASLYCGMMIAETLRLAGAKGQTLVDGPMGADPTTLRMVAAATKRPVRTVEGGTSEGAAQLALPQGTRPPPLAAAPVVEGAPTAWHEYHERWLTRVGTDAAA